jgi:hypothetical protein
MVGRNLVESAMQAFSELVGWILALRTTLAGDDHARRGDPGQTG